MKTNLPTSDESSDLEDFTSPSLPSTWCWATPRDLASLDEYALAIGPFGSNLKVSDYRDDGVPLVFVRNIRSGTFGGTSARYVSVTKAEELAAHSVDGDDILITKMGDPPGDAYVYPSTEVRAIITADCIKFRLNRQLGIPRFFVHAVNSRVGREQIALITKGVAQQKVSLGRFAQIRLPVPPLPEQHRIVAKIEELFSDLDAGVAALKRAKANLKRYRASVLKAAVEGKLTEAWRAEHPDTEPATKLLERILTARRQKWEADQLAKFAAAGKQPPKNWKEKYLEPKPPDTTGLPVLPKGWFWASVEQTCEVGTGATPPRTKAAFYERGTIPWILSTAVNQPFVDEAKEFLTDAALQEAKLRLYPSGTLLIALYGEGRTRGMVSELRIEATINQALGAMVFCGLAANVRPYIKQFLASAYVSLRRQAAGGMQPNLNLGIVKQIAVPLPPLAEQRQIMAEVEERLSLIAAAEKEIAHSLLRAARLRQSILKQAFEGKLVPQDPTDEPASVLLERLRANLRVQERNGKAVPSGRTSKRRRSKR